MPRTKQKPPQKPESLVESRQFCVKDKIEEAQKELKAPKSTQKGICESSTSLGGASDGIKGLKRKKVVAENQLKKIPKSPVKKPSHPKNPVPTPGTATATAHISNAPSRGGSPSSTSSSSSPSSFPNSPSCSLDSSQHHQDTDDGQQQQESPSPHKVTAEEVEASSFTELLPQDPQACSKNKSNSHDSSVESWGVKLDSEGTSTAHPSAPLDVLLKAMEPDFNTLTERTVEKLGASVVSHSGVPAAMPAVKYGVPPQPGLMQPYDAAKQFYPGTHVTLQAGVPSAKQYPAAHMRPTSQQFMSLTASGLQPTKPALHKGYGAGQSTAMTHAPIPSGSSGLPQSQPPVVQTCQSLSASVPSTIQVPVTPGYNPMQMATVVNFGSLEQVCSITAKDQKPKKQGKYVCEYCNRACAKPSVLLKHIRSHTGERPYPCVTCGFSFKTKSNLYKHKKSHAHAIKLGLTVRSDSQSQSQESDKGLGGHSDVDESGESDEEGSTADLDPDSSQSSATALSESSPLSLGTVQGSQGELDLPVVFETLKPVSSQKGVEPKVSAPLPKVVVYPVNVSPLRADSPRVTDLTPEQATAQRQREFQVARSNITVLSSLKEVDCSSPLQDSISEDEDPQGKSPGVGHAQLQRQQATDCSQQQQGKCLLSPRSLGSTDSGYFSRSESADQAMSPPSPFVKITPPAEADVTKNLLTNPAAITAPIMHVTAVEKTHILEGQMRPPLDSRTLSLEERISKLISDNEAVVDDKQLDSVKPRRTSLSRRGSIDSPKSYIFKDSFQFDLKPFVRRSSSSSDIPKSPFTPTEKSKPVFLLSVPPQYPHMDCLPITRSNSMPTTPGHSGLPPNVTPQPHPLRICHSFDDKISSFNDDVFSSTPSTPNLAVHPRTLVRQIAVEDSSTSEGHGLPTVRSMDDAYHGPSISTEMQRSKSFEHGNRKPQQNKGTMFECETCRNRYRKRENFENHKKFYCSELHGPKNKPIPVREPESDVFVQSVPPLMTRTVCHSGNIEQSSMIRKRRKMKSFGDDDDQSPTDKNPPCSRSFDSCQTSSRVVSSSQFPQRAVLVNLQPANNTGPVPPIQLMARVAETPESRLSPARDNNISTSTKDRGEMQRQGSGTSVIRHTNSLSRPNSFETYESIDLSSPVDSSTKDMQGAVMSSTESSANTSLQNYHKEMSIPKGSSQEKYIADTPQDHAPAVASESSAPTQQSRLVRQNNIPEILVTEEPDREHESQVSDKVSVEKPSDTFNWPQRSESLSKLPTEKLPPKKKRIRLAQMEHSSGESSFESSLSRSLSRDSSLSRCSSISASFERDEPPRADSPSRESVTKPPDVQGPPVACNTLSVPVMMRRAASEQISCTQPSIAISCDYRSKSFDSSSMSPNRSPSPLDTAMPKSAQPATTAQIPLIERRRGPLVRQMSLKIGPESQQFVGKQHTVSLQRAPSSNIVSVTQHRPPMINRASLTQPFVLHSGEPPPPQKNEHVVQSINLGSQTQHPQVHGLPHPWHQTSRVVAIQKVLPAVQIIPCQTDVESKPAESQKSLVPKYQLQYPVLKSQTYSLSGPQGTQGALPVITIRIGNEIESVSKAAEGIQNVYVAQKNLQGMSNKSSIVLPLGIQGDAPSQNQAGSAPVPQILITHEQIHPACSMACKTNISPMKIATIDNKAGLDAQTEKPQVQVQPGANTQSHTSDNRNNPSLGSLHCIQKMASVNLCPQQEPTASSKRMLSPANSLDIAMEKHQKRAKDEHGAACQPTDGRSLSYLNSKMAEVTRQRKLTLVRQVCTTEPVDSPIETEAPQDLEKLDPGKDFQVPDTGSATTTANEMTAQMQDDKPPSPTDHPMQSPVSRTSPGVQSYPIPANATLKPQDKPEEQQRWSSNKSPLRPSTFQGQVKLASSVSVVNTRDSHRLSFPSLKTATTFTWCFLIKRKPLHIPQTDQRISAYSTWPVSKNNPNPLGLPTKIVMSLFDSKQKAKKIHYTQAITTSLKSDILTYSSKLKDVMPKVMLSQKSLSTESKSKARPESRPPNEADRESLAKAEPRRIKIFDGGFKSNEEYVYVRGRGRGKYICEECGIRCKKPSMLRKHIRTHSDVRPYHCAHCNFSFKTKGNLTKHMKSKAHSKKCLEMGVSVGLIEDQDAEDSGDRGRGSSADRPDSDGDDSDGPEDEDNDGEEEDEEDSQAESGLSATPSVSASPQHFGTDVAPSSLLAQMSISSSQPPHALPPTQHLPHIPSTAPDLDLDSVAMLSPLSPSKQMSISTLIPCSSPTSVAPFARYPIAMASAIATTCVTYSSSDPHGSDSESVHMMSPVSPCRQMSIDYPDFDVPSSPPAPGKGSKLGQDASARPPPMPSSESGVPVDRGTQTSSFAHHGSLHFPSQGPMSLMGEPLAHTHLFSHLPLHSQQPSRSPYSMVPVGGIQLVSAGLAAYSTFVPIQAGPVQLTIPALSVIHRNTSPLPALGSDPGSGPATSPARPGASPTTQHPLVVQESVGNMLPCFPLSQMAGIRTLGGPQATLQQVGLEALGVMGLANSGLAPTQLIQQQNLALNASLGVQVLTASPAVQSSQVPQAHIPGLQILNITLPALIPSLSPLSSLSPLPSAPDRPWHLEASAGLGLGPSRSPSSGLGPSRSPSSGLGPSRSPSSGLGPSRSPSSGLGPSRSPSSGPGPSRSPSSGLGPSRSPSSGLGPSRSPSAELGLGPSRSISPCRPSLGSGCRGGGAQSACTTPVLTLSASPPVAMSTTSMAPVVVTTHAPKGASPCRPSLGSSCGGGGAQSACTSERKGRSPTDQTLSSPDSFDGASQIAPAATTTGGTSEARPPHKHTSPRPPALADDCSEASSDDEDRLVIAT